MSFLNLSQSLGKMPFIANFTRRAANYFRRHGLKQSAIRLSAAVRRIPSAGSLIVYGCDLPVAPPSDSPQFLVEPYQSLQSLGHAAEAIKKQWVSSIVERNMGERFGVGATLWLARQEDMILGYGWTLQGRTMRPHYQPLLPTDAHLFDFFVLPDQRGRGINVHLVDLVLAQVSAAGARRAWIECAPWNIPQIRSLAKTPFERCGVVRTLNLGKCKMTIWDPEPAT